MEIKTNEEIINLIKELVILHPNDNELGKIIRKLILEKK